MSSPPIAFARDPCAGRRRPWQPRIAGVLGILSLLAVPRIVSAHEIPASVTLHAFVAPQAQRLHLLVRAPLAAMRDIEWPLRDDAYLDFAAAQPLLHDAARLWILDYVTLYEGATPLTDARVLQTRVSIPSDRSFTSYQTALDHLRGPPLEGELDLPWQQALLDVLIEVPVSSGTSDFSILPQWAHLGVRTTTVLRFRTEDGRERVFQYSGDPGLVRLDPRWHQAVLRFVKLGFLHILDGVDHLLFLLCLVVPFRRFGPLVLVVTSFTVAHSITLIASASGLAPDALWFPPLVETLIALSIVYMALENIVGARLERRWAFAFGFGLVHGFGFSFLLRDSLQFAGAHLFTSLLAFNIGVELGQILVVAIAIPALNVLFRWVVAERMGTILLSAIVAHTAWHWMTERWADLRGFTFTPPVLDLALLATLTRWLILALLVAGAAGLLRTRFRFPVLARSNMPGGGREPPAAGTAGPSPG